MSADFRPEKKIDIAQLFDGRLEIYGVSEYVNENTTLEGRCLEHEEGHLWVQVNNFSGILLTQSMSGGDPRPILGAISRLFDTEIYSEDDPEFWGFASEEEIVEAFKKRETEFNNELMKFLRDEPSDIRPGTDDMEMANIAKDLVTANPDLLSEDKKEELRGAMNSIYERDHLVSVAL